MLHSDLMLRDVTFATARELGDRYRTGVRPTATRLVSDVGEAAMLVSSRPGRPARCLKRSSMVSVDFWLRETPGPEAVAHALLRGSTIDPGPAEVPVDAWIDRDEAWWFTLHEDSFRLPGGEVLSLLWWTGDAHNDIVGAPNLDDPLPYEPDREALERLVECLCQHWGYRRARDDRGQPFLVTHEPATQRLVLPGYRALGAAALRRLVDEVASHKGEHRNVILNSMVP